MTPELEETAQQRNGSFEQFTARKSKQERQIAEEAANVERLQKHVETLGKELNKHQKLAGQLEESGVASDDLRRKIAAKESEIQTAQTEIDKANGRKAEAKTALDGLEPYLWLANYALNTVQEEVPVIGSISELFSKSQVHIHTSDGHPTTVEIQFAVKGSRPFNYELAVLHGDIWMVSGFMPAELRWVPKQWLAVESAFKIDYHTGVCDVGVTRDGNRDYSLACLYALNGGETLLPTTEKLGWRVKNPNYTRGGSYSYGGKDEPEWHYFERAIGQHVPSFENLLTQELSQASEGLDLTREYQANSFLSFLQSRILSVTVPVTEQQFEPAGDPLGSDEIANRLRPYWQQFVSGPWRPEMDGLLANLKYYCERGEVPRFYSQKFQESYGFRLRTRDHSWITGAVYVLPGEIETGDSNVKQLQVIKDEREDQGCLFRLGRMVACIAGEERVRFDRD